MKTVSVGLVSLFASGNAFLMADCYKIQLTNGSILRFTNFDTDITFASQTWLKNAPIFTRTQTRIVIGLEVDTLQLIISPSDSDMIGAQTWLQAVCSGVFDGALITLDRAFMDMDLNVAGTVNMFVGYVAQLTIDRMNIEMTVNSPLDLMSVQMPRNLYQSACQHVLFSSGCGAIKASFTTAGTVSGSPTILSFTSAVAGVTGRYNLGTLQFTSGALSGTKRSVK